MNVNCMICSGLYRMIIRICGRWFCMKLILKIFIRCANVLILMLMCVESESMKWLFRTEMGCSKYLSVLFMQVSLNRGIFDSARPVKLFCS